MQLCVWNAKPGYEKQTSKQLQIPRGRVAAPYADTRVQFHQDQTHLLVVHETQIAIFEAPRLECLKQVCFLCSYFSVYSVASFDAMSIILYYKIQK